MIQLTAVYKMPTFQRQPILFIGSCMNNDRRYKGIEMLLHFLLFHLFLFSEGCYCDTNVKKKRKKQLPTSNLFQVFVLVSLCLHQVLTEMRLLLLKCLAQ